MSAQVVAEEERVALVRRTRDTDVDIDRSAGTRLEEELAPPLVRPGRARRPVVLPDIFTVEKPRPRERRRKAFPVERGDGDLYADEVLRREVWDGGRADVVDALGERSECLLKGRGDRIELGWPRRPRFDDRDPPGGFGDPGGNVNCRPARTCRWRCQTDWPAVPPLFTTTRKLSACPAFFATVRAA